jgi:hypothetical protein
MRPNFVALRPNFMALRPNFMALRRFLLSRHCGLDPQSPFPSLRA